MLVFVDESGDLGFKFERGSTRFFTIALVAFEDSKAALVCQQAIVALRQRLSLPERFEFHFHDDSHDRRLAFMSTVARYQFSCYTFTLDKQLEQRARHDLGHASPDYKWVCRMALDSVGAELSDATIVIDGSGERRFSQQMKDYLRRELNSEQRRMIHKVKVSRSTSDHLIQLADYVAGVTNRLYEGKPGTDQYESYLRRKRRSQRKWP